MPTDFILVGVRISEVGCQWGLSAQRSLRAYYAPVIVGAAAQGNALAIVLEFRAGSHSGWGIPFSPGAGSEAEGVRTGQATGASHPDKGRGL